ncbi:MAG: S41 family peptidase [Planctomycetota bacterium]
MPFDLRFHRSSVTLCLIALFTVQSLWPSHACRGQTTDSLRLVQDPTLSPDGSVIVFSHGGNLWRVPSSGGRARPLTLHPAADRMPRFSRDGQSLAFISRRDGQEAIYRMPMGRGAPRRVTFHSEGYQLIDWYPDHRQVLAIGSRDHFWRHATRLMRIDTDRRDKDHVLANAYATDASLSSDGKRVLLVREGERWWRKGYYGARSAQIWLLDLSSGKFQLVLSETYDCRWPRWIGDQDAFVFTRGMPHGYELCRFDFSETTGLSDAGEPSEAPENVAGDPLAPLPGIVTQLTEFGEDSVVYPSVSADGSQVVFRHLFDLYTLPLTEGKKASPSKVNVLPPLDQVTDQQLRRTYRSADDVAFTQDGLEMAFVAGGDLWVMDTKLREPRQVTRAAGWDESPVFSVDDETLYAIRDVEGRKDIYRIQREDDQLYWWQNESFVVTNLTKDSAVESDLRISPDGERLFFVRGRGDLVHTNLDGQDRVRLTRGFSPPEYDVSADGRWVAYSQSNDDFNSEVFLIDSAGRRQPYNVSRHPDDDSGPVFSPDGKLLAFTGRRVDREVDIHYVWLQAEERDKSNRARELDEAIELIQKKRKKKSGGKAPDDPSQKADPSKEATKPNKNPDDPEPDENAEADDKATEKSGEPIRIDFQRLHQRLKRISVADTSERSLIWDPESERLAFTATIDGKQATYTVQFPDELRPKEFSSTTGRPIAWTKESGGLLMLAGGVPALVKGNETRRYSFTANQAVDRGSRLQAAFDTAWRVMRDRWYDGNTGGRNWASVRRKYRPIARLLPDENALGELILLMLGELNGSHNGFYPRPFRTYDSGQDWKESTAHLGVRFDSGFQGPGLKIRDVIGGSPADKVDSKLNPGEIILSIDGVDVDIDMDLTQVLNGRLDRDIHLVVLGEAIKQTTKAALSREEAAEQPETGNGPPDDSPEAGKQATPEEAATEDDASPEESDGDDSSDDRPAESPEVEDDSDEPGDNESDERRVVIRPISYAAARGLLYDDWLRFNREEVERLSDGKLGYLHIRAMNMSSFYEFERQLYAAGFGRDGLVIDVRENGGGSTTDHLLTSLTQPEHATTVPRGGGSGYPQSRKVYATWNRPIIVLCNQNSYSNAEIFSHAIKSLRRGRLVGVPTAGGVISTGAVSIMDVGTMRMPFRAWFVNTSGEDMEMAGCVPDTVIWPLPGEIPAGNDRQLSTAVEQLLEDVAKWKQQAPPKRVYATERTPPKPGPVPLK